MRKICYITGTRADFGLVEKTLIAINEYPELEISLIVTGMHLLPDYGETWKEIEKTGINISTKIHVKLSGESGKEMSLGLGKQVIEFTKELDRIKPDILLLLGDRGEMLAGAIAGMHLGIHIAHLHGGERSGTIDESIRHAISKISHYHFVSTARSRDRLIKMGEKQDNIFVTGAPGLDAIVQHKFYDKETLLSKYELDFTKPFSLIIFHPVVQQKAFLRRQMQIIFEVVSKLNIQSLVILPNSDSGGQDILQVINANKKLRDIKVAAHIPRSEYISVVHYAEVMLGNSSSAIIEAASLGTPVVNIGNRQNLRERNENVIDVPPDEGDILSALQIAIKMKGKKFSNIYGEGNAYTKIVEKLTSISLDGNVLEKLNCY